MGALILLILVLAGPSVRGAQIGGVPSPLPGTPAPLPRAPGLIAWSVDLPAAPIVSPLIANDVVIATYLPGIVAAFRTSDGTQLWRVELSPEQPLAADGPLVYVVAGEAIHALRLADGSVAWRVPAGTVTGPPLAKDGWLLTHADSTLTARRAADGSAVWTVDSGVQRELGAISGDMVVIPLADGRLVARDLLGGQIKWERRLGGAPGPPAVIGEDVFVGASDRRFYCIDVRDGEIDWDRPVRATIRGAATSDGERVFFSAFDNMVHALDLWNGTLRWESAVSFRPITGALAAGGGVFVAGPDQGVRIFRAADGRAHGTLAFPSRLAIGPAFADTGAGAVFAAVTGNLEESWRLSLTIPVSVPATARPPRSAPAPPAR